MSLRKMVWFLGAIIWIHCGTKDQGGTHIPNLKSYEVSSLPEGSDSGSQIASDEFSGQALNPFVHISPIYKVCLPNFSDADLKAARTYVQRTGEELSDMGLQGILNQTLKNLSTIGIRNKGIADRIEIDVVRTAKTCDFTLLTAQSSEFPFSHEDFADETVVLLQRGQIQAGGSNQNSIPVGFIDDDEAFKSLRVQQLIGAYIGLIDSSGSESYLNPNLNSLAGDWLIAFNDDLSGSKKTDSVTLYGFGLIYNEFVSPEDANRFHHYQDQFNGTAEEDELLTVENQGSPIDRVQLESAYLNWATQVPNTLKVCIANASSQSFLPDDYEALLNQVSYEEPGTILFYTHQKNEQVQTHLAVSSDGCQLVVALRDNDQYPFVERHLNGAFASRGSIAGIEIDVIYLNVEELSLQEADKSRFIGDVFRHEFAHFLGFKHSQSQDSLLAPAGYQSSLDLSVDQFAIDEFAEQF